MDEGRTTVFVLFAIILPVAVVVIAVCCGNGGGSGASVSASNGACVSPAVLGGLHSRPHLGVFGVCLSNFQVH